MSQLGKFTTKSAADIPTLEGLDMLLYADQGTGKTWLVGTAQDSPHGANVLLIDVDGGARTVSHNKGIEVIKPETFKDIEDVCTAVIQEAHHFKTVAIDSLSEAQRVLSEDLQRGSRTAAEGLTMQQWGQIGDRMHALIRRMRHVAKSKGYNVIFTAFEALSNDERTGRSKRVPALSPAVRNKVAGTIDSVALLEVDYKSVPKGATDVEYARVLTLENRPDTITKTRQPKLGEHISFNPLPGRITNPSMVDILAIVHTPPTAS